jgi:hypothetical protein
MPLFWAVVDPLCSPSGDWSELDATPGGRACQRKGWLALEKRLHGRGSAVCLCVVGAAAKEGLERWGSGGVGAP